MAVFISFSAETIIFENLVIPGLLPFQRSTKRRNFPLPWFFVCIVSTIHLNWYALVWDCHPCLRSHRDPFSCLEGLILSIHYVPQSSRPHLIFLMFEGSEIPQRRLIFWPFEGTASRPTWYDCRIGYPIHHWEWVLEYEDDTLPTCELETVDFSVLC